MASVSCRSAKGWLLLDAKIFLLEATSPRSHPAPTVFDSSSAMENSMYTELLHAAEMRTLAMIADGAGLKDVLTYRCESIDIYVSPSVTSVLLMEPDGKHLVLTAGPRVPFEWVCAIG